MTNLTHQERRKVGKEIIEDLLTRFLCVDDQHPISKSLLAKQNGIIDLEHLAALNPGDFYTITYTNSDDTIAHCLSSYHAHQCGRLCNFAKTIMGKYPSFLFDIDMWKDYSLDAFSNMVGFDVCQLAILDNPDNDDENSATFAKDNNAVSLSRQQDQEILEYLLLELLNVDADHPIATSLKDHHINYVSDLIATDVHLFSSISSYVVHQAKCKQLRNYALMFVNEHGYIPPVMEWKKLTWESFQLYKAYRDTNLVPTSILQSFPWTTGYISATVNTDLDSSKDKLDCHINGYMPTLVGEPNPIEPI